MAKKQKTSETDLMRRRQQQVLLGGALLLISILLGISFLSYLFSWQTDYSTLGALSDKSVEAKNLLNKLGAYVSHFFVFKGVGLSAFLFVYLTGLTGFKLFFRKSTPGLLSTWAWGVAHMLWLSVVLAYFWVETPLFSGIIGFEVHDFLVAYIGKVGLFGILLFFFLCFIVIELEMTPERIMTWIESLKKEEKETEETLNNIPGSEDSISHDI